MEPDVNTLIAELRGRCTALEVFMAALLYAGFKSGPEAELLKRLVTEGEETLIRVRNEAADDGEREIAEFAMIQYRDMVMQLVANLEGKPTKN
jgi:hypothetical protein